MSLLWAPFTLLAAVAQIFRNGAQAGLAARIGTLGATQVRFIFALPFAVLFLALALVVAGEALPAFTPSAFGWTLAGAVCQIGGTAMMLVVMGRRAFGVAYAYIKTEPIVVALFGVLLLGDRLPMLAWLAVGVVTAGVLLASVRPGQWAGLVGEAGMIGAGLFSGGLTGFSSIAFRGAIAALPTGNYVVRSLSILTATLAAQTILLGSWLALRRRAAFIGSLRDWRASFGAGFAGALASAGFFVAFSLTPAANVRTLALVELPLAAVFTHRVSGKRMAGHELLGMAVVMGGVALLLAAHAA